MSARAVERVLFRSILEPQFREHLLADAGAAMSGYELTTEELAVLQTLTPEKYHGLVGGLVAHRLVSLRVTPRFVVASPEAALPLDALPIYLGSGWAFGNGTHPTTALALAALSEHMRPGQAVLDVGTGTGILAIAAARLGAASVYAFDIDAQAVEAARHNVRLNDVQPLVATEQSSVEAVVRSMTGADWDIVIVNIIASISLRLFADGLARAVAPNGVLILSAIKPHEVAMVSARLRAADLEIIAERQQEGWLALIARHPANDLAQPVDGAH